MRGALAFVLAAFVAGTAGASPLWEGALEACIASVERQVPVRPAKNWHRRIPESGDGRHQAEGWLESERRMMVVAYPAEVVPDLPVESGVSVGACAVVHWPGHGPTRRAASNWVDHAIAERGFVDATDVMTWLPGAIYRVALVKCAAEPPHMMVLVGVPDESVTQGIDHGTSASAELRMQSPRGGALPCAD